MITNWHHIGKLNIDDWYEKYKFYSVGRKKRRTTYINIPFAIDIETTSTKLNDIHGNKVEIAIPYVGMIGIDSKVYYFRYMQELKYTLDYISDYLEEKDVHLICLIHFFGYEFSFFSNFLYFENIFAVDKNHPIKAEYRNIEFRDSYILSGYSLEKLAENYTKTKKLKGDLDYKKIRYPETPLTKKEIGYCKNDVIILNEYWEYLYKRFLSGSNKKLPLTNTGVVRDAVRNNIPNNIKHSYYRYIKANNPSYEVYKYLELAFQGGFVHANYKYTGFTLSGIDSFDYASSYPGVMFEYKFPVTKLVPIEFDMDKFNTKKYAYLMKMEFTNIRSKSPNRTISFSKILNRPNEFKCDNGRLITADKIVMWLTEVDLKVIDMFYSYTLANVEKCYVSRKAYLPRFILEKVVDFYKSKMELKDVKGKEVEYLVSKGMLNSIYGMMVTKQDYGKIVFENNEWIEKEGEYAKDKKQFLLYQWGVWVTSFARYNLLSMVNKVNNDVVYCDTDSIKLRHVWKYNSLFDDDNKRLEERIKKCCKHAGIKYDDVSGLGLWEHEHDGKSYDEFITWGAKRYMSDGKVTLSGFPKKIMDKGEMVDHMDYLSKKFNKTKIELFRPPFKLSKEDSGKTILKYHYSDVPTTCQYYYDNQLHEITLNNWIYSEPTTFKMELGVDYESLLGYSRYQVNTGGLDYELFKGF